MEHPVPQAPLSTRAPLLGAACALTLGMGVGHVCAAGPLPLAVAGAALARVPGTTWCRALSWALSGWILIQLAEGPWREAARTLGEERPVTLIGRVVGCWEEGDAVWAARFRVRSVRQGAQVLSVSRAVRLYARDRPHPSGCGGVYRVRGYLHPPRRFENSPPTRVGEWSLFVESPRLIRAVAPPGAWASLSSLLRDRLFAAIDDESPGERLARALLTGERGRLPPRWTLGLQRWGLSHLLAVSGLHVGIVVVGVALLAAPLPRGARLAAAFLAVALYLAVAGPRPSLVRAATMFGLGAGAFLVRRPPSPLNALALAVLALLIGDPTAVTNVGLQLSVVATTGILLLGGPLSRRLEPLPSQLSAALAVTLAAQIATLPWSLSVFHRLTLLAPLANLLAGPWIALSLVAAIGWAGSRVLHPGTERGFGALLDLLADPLDVLASVPPRYTGSLAVDPGWVVTAGVTAGCSLGIGLLWHRTSGPPRRVLGGSLLIGSILLGTGGAIAPEPHPELLLLDVGQGDGIVLRDDRQALVLDAGGWNRPGFGFRVVAPVLARAGIRAPTILAVSHGDRDHCGGISDLARELPTRSLWLPLGSEGSPCVRELSSLPWLRPRYLREGDVLRVGRWRLWVLAPAPGYRGSPNGGSLVLRAQIFDRCVLLTGDIDAAAERRLLARWPPEILHCEMLKVAHHGSKSSTVRAFLRAARPRTALISAGRGNRYGHPADEVLRRLERSRVHVLGTARRGMIRVRWTEGGAVWITTTREPIRTIAG